MRSVQRPKGWILCEVMGLGVSHLEAHEDLTFLRGGGNEALPLEEQASSRVPVMGPERWSIRACAHLW